LAASSTGVSQGQASLAFFCNPVTPAHANCHARIALATDYPVPRFRPIDALARFARQQASPRNSTQGACRFNLAFLHHFVAELRY